jgi:hypothetical protein
MVHLRHTLVRDQPKTECGKFEKDVRLYLRYGSKASHSRMRSGTGSPHPSSTVNASGFRRIRL